MTTTKRTSRRPASPPCPRILIKSLTLDLEETPPAQRSPIAASPPAAPRERNSGVDLDLDDLLSGFDEPDPDSGATRIAATPLESLSEDFDAGFEEEPTRIAHSVHPSAPPAATPALEDEATRIASMPLSTPFDAEEQPGPKVAESSVEEDFFFDVVGSAAPPPPPAAMPPLALDDEAFDPFADEDAIEMGGAAVGDPGRASGVVAAETPDHEPASGMVVKMPAVEQAAEQAAPATGTALGMDASGVAPAATEAKAPGVIPKPSLPGTGPMPPRPRVPAGPGGPRPPVPRPPAAFRPPAPAVPGRAVPRPPSPSALRERLSRPDGPRPPNPPPPAFAKKPLPPAGVPRRTLDSLQPRKARPLEAPDETAKPDALAVDRLETRSSAPPGPEAARDEAATAKAVAIEPGLAEDPSPIGQARDAGTAEPDLLIADDEPEAEVLIADDDEPEAGVLIADDDEPEAEVLIADDDEPAETEAIAPEEEEEPTRPSSPAPARSISRAPTDDQGAAAARRTVSYRKPRKEHFPLVGRSTETQRARRELLEQLAEGATGAARARLLSASAETCEQLGEEDAARALYVTAHEADPRDVIPLRALRRDAIARGDFAEVARLLEGEAALALSPADRGLVSAALAEVQLSHLGDPAAAEKSARNAMMLRRDSVGAALLFAETCFAQGKDIEALAALERAADAWHQPKAKAALLLEVGRAIEHTGQAKRARDYFSRALEANPSALDAAIGVARTARATGDVDGAIGALIQAAGVLHGPVMPEAFLRIAGRLAHVAVGRPADTMALLADARSMPALRARAQAALAAGTPEEQMGAVEAWAQASGGTERALALVQLADLRAQASDFDGADQALRDAALADSALGTVRVVRELLARKAGPGSKLSRVLDGADVEGAALASAARVARDPSAVTRERELLERAADEAESPVCADVLMLDAAAQVGDAEAVRAALRRHADRLSGDRKVGPLLLLSELASQEDVIEAAEALLQEARDVAPGEPLVLRPLADVVGRRDGTEAASYWLEEASSASGERAAFAATVAGRLLEGAGADPAPAYRRALDAAPGYPPAVWALEPVARRAGDLETLLALNERLAETAPDPTEVTGRLVRAALLRAGDNPASAAALLERARSTRPDDVIVHELLMRLGDATAVSQRAVLLETMAESAPDDLARPAWLRVAAAWEDAGDPGKAAEVYRKLLADHPLDPFAAEALDRVEIQHGEHARVAERRFATLRAAEDDNAKIAALEALADLDLYDRNDPSSAILSLQSILEIAPGHIPSLRVLERYFMAQGRDQEVLPIEEALARHLEASRSVAAHARMAARLHLAAEGAHGDAADALLLEAVDRAGADGWIARRAEPAAEAAGDLPRLVAARTALASRVAPPLERASYEVRVAEAEEARGDRDAAITWLTRAVATAETHPIAAAELGRLEEVVGRPSEAAEAFERAARGAAAPRHAASLWHRAAALWQDEREDLARAKAALTSACALDVTWADAFDRLRQMLADAEDLQGLADLTAKRLEAGGEAAVLAELHLGHADLCQRLGDRDGAREALRAALALSPEQIDALRRLSELSLEEQDFRGAAEALIRIARLRKDREELRRVFFTLGDIYDRHMPDARRAEAAFRRVLKLVPDDLDAMARLAELYRKQGDMAQAAELLQQLANLEVDPDRSRGFRLTLAATLEEHGDARQAEAVLEQTRRNTPTDIVVLRAVADFYERQNAQAALAMHLSRAVNDFRQVIANDPADAEAWPGLVKVLEWREHHDEARASASAAGAMGVIDVELGRLLDPHGGVPGAEEAAANAELDDLLSPPSLTAPTRAVFRLAAEALEKVLPFDPKALRAEKVHPRDTPFKDAAAEVGRWFGTGEVQLWVTGSAPRICVPIGDSPVAVLLGRDLFTTTEENERLFLLVRAVKIAASRMSVAVRSQPQYLAAALGGLIRNYDPNYTTPGVDQETLDEMTRRVGKAIPRRVREELAPITLEMAGAPSHDPGRLGLAASELGDRAALLALGSMPASLGALLKLAGHELALRGGARERAEAVRRVPEAASLLAFAISDAHFEARRRTGAAQR